MAQNQHFFVTLDNVADHAYSIALNNADDIKEIKANNKWSWGYMIGLGITILGYFLTKL